MADYLAFQVDRFDWFLYMEDTLDLTVHHLHALIKDTTALQDTGYLPGLLRFELPSCAAEAKGALAPGPSTANASTVLPHDGPGGPESGHRGFAKPPPLRPFNLTSIYLRDFWTCCHPLVSEALSVGGRAFMRPSDPVQGYYLLPRRIMHVQVLCAGHGGAGTRVCHLGIA